VIDGALGLNIEAERIGDRLIEQQRVALRSRRREGWLVEHDTSAGQVALMVAARVW
jgi:hypothetical protein